MARKTTKPAAEVAATVAVDVETTASNAVPAAKKTRSAAPAAKKTRSAATATTATAHADDTIATTAMVPAADDLIAAATATADDLSATAATPTADDLIAAAMVPAADDPIADDPIAAADDPIATTATAHADDPIADDPIATTAMVPAADDLSAITKKPRLPAKELMAKRTHATFGTAFKNGVIGGFQKDHAKILLMAITMKIGRPSDLKRLTLETLRERLAEAIKAAPEGTLPTRAEFPQVAAVATVGPVEAETTEAVAPAEEAVA